MCDTFHPLRLTTLARDLDDGRYALSWYDEPGAPAYAGRGPGGRHLAPLSRASTARR